jgi:hypothetical protein
MHSPQIAQIVPETTVYSTFLFPRTAHGMDEKLWETTVLVIVTDNYVSGSSSFQSSPVDYRHTVFPIRPTSLSM